MKNISSHWMEILDQIRRSDAHNILSNWLQLPTIGIDNRPHVRTVVFCDFSSSD